MKTGDEKIALMHKEYGTLMGATCKSCDHLEAHCNADCTRIWYKCRMYGVSSGAGTDWRAGNTACGAIAIEPNEAKRRKLYGEVYRRTKGLRAKKQPEQLEGQMTMEI